MAEVFANSQRSRRENPRLLIIVDKSAQGLGNIERCQVQANAALFYVEPAQSVPGVVTCKVRQFLDHAQQLLMQFVDPDRRLGNLDHAFLQGLQGTAEMVERLPDVRQNCGQFVPPFSMRRIRTQYFQCRLRLVNASLQRGLAHRHRCAAEFVKQAFEFTTPETYAEELRGQIGDLVRFIENDCFGAGQKFNESLLFQGEIGQ